MHWPDVLLIVENDSRMKFPLGCFIATTATLLAFLTAFCVATIIVDHRLETTGNETVQRIAKSKLHERSVHFEPVQLAQILRREPNDQFPKQVFRVTSPNLGFGTSQVSNVPLLSEDTYKASLASHQRRQVGTFEQTKSNLVDFSSEPLSQSKVSSSTRPVVLQKPIVDPDQFESRDTTDITGDSSPDKMSIGRQALDSDSGFVELQAPLEKQDDEQDHDQYNFLASQPTGETVDADGDRQSQPAETQHTDVTEERPESEQITLTTKTPVDDEPTADNKQTADEELTAVKDNNSIGNDPEQSIVGARSQISSFDNLSIKAEPTEEPKKTSDGQEFGSRLSTADSNRRSAKTSGDNPRRPANQSLKVPTETAKTIKQTIVGWPLPAALMNDLDELSQIPMTQMWAAAAKSSFTELNQLELSDPSSLPLLTHCEQLAVQLAQHATQLMQSNPQHSAIAAEFARVAYRIRRRIDIWKIVHQLAEDRATSIEGGSIEKKDTKYLAQTISSRKENISIRLPDDWREYLLLDRAQEIFSDDKANELKRRAISRKILARISTSTLTNEQRNYANQVIGENLIHDLRNAATGEFKLGQFLVDLERFETNPTASNQARFNDHYQNYYWHSEAATNQLATAINGHYRNANFRIAVSDSLINRMLPRSMHMEQPVKDQMLGANIRGKSRISNLLQVRLIPDPQKLSFRFQTLGSVFSRTRAHHHSGFIFHNTGNARVNTSKGIAIGADGISVLPTDVNASSQQRLLGIDSRFDGLPVFGLLARRIAQQQQASQEPKANKMVEQKLKFEFQSRVDREIQQRIGQAQTWFTANVYQPLSALELEPTPLEMKTTDQQVVIRYRVASLDQMAANTARPNSLPGSLMNIQVHQTAVNNLLNKIQINGRKFTIDEFMDHLNQLLGREDLQIPEAERHDVTFEFHSRDGIRMDFDDDRVTISLRLKRLRIGKGKSWRNLIVKAHYFPQTNGTRMELILDQETGVLLKGYRLGFADQLAVRTVFNSVFKTYFDFSIVPTSISQNIDVSDLFISQLTLDEGWIGISVDANRAAAAPQNQYPANPPRTSRLFKRWR